MVDTTVKGTIAICTSCGAPNRVAAGKPLSAGKCGKCHEPLATQTPVEIDGAMLERLLARDTGAFVLDVWAPWCGPCRMMAPAYEASAARFADHVRFFKLNSDQNQETAGKLGIRGIPTLIAWQDGDLIANQSGAQTGEGLSRWIQSTFGLSA
ncbi:MULTISPECIES: thioredoxin family protein [Hyphomonas]|uniref:Thiol reductase thioredoxin n=1 Tax=Hyphomonas adhaerens TaxID=81029 RepID=A0A3B9GXQ3_9PROT|nr:MULTISPECIES: thioredoxin domain-containing protein [Hyphomonas]MBB38472.1 thiol reductase thioredoxin [Hyphomonas sp.]MBB40408.1 thiol reductase thioredoxin [Hyphomonas sp.]HAE27245.1 thiol reductase thioredoxin [Hyphomonas adhaerens]|tara:strand:- start:643 stop:1101 length:459 start_codon:yes stop_codon:yes gene_type:complete